MTWVRLIATMNTCSYGMRKVSGSEGTRIRDLRCDRFDETLRLQRLRVTPSLWGSSVTDLAGNRPCR